MNAPGRLAAIEALERGVANVRANSELVLAQILGSLLMAASILIPAIYLLGRIGLPWSLLASNDTEAIREATEAMSLDLPSLLPLLGFALLLFAVVGTLVFVLYCFVQAGTLAALSAADAQAPPGRGLPLEVYRTFSWRLFAGWSRRFGWRLFWLLNLYLALVTAIVGLVAIVVVLSASAFGDGSAWAGCLLGCGLSVPLVFLLFVLWISTQLGSAALVVEDCSVGRAFRQGLSLTGRRLGAVLLLLLLLFAGSFVISMFFGLIGFGVNLVLSSPSVLRSAVSGGLGFLQLALNTVLSLVFLGAFVALARDAHRAERSAAG